MVGQKLSWVGLSIGDYVIKDLLGEGSFSWVFRAVHSDGVTARAVKVAKPPEAVAEGGPTSCIPTSALCQTFGCVVDVTPDCEQLLQLQAKRLQLISDPSLVDVEELCARPGGCYYRMPVLPGQTLRQYMNSGPVPVDVLLDIALCLDRLTDPDDINGNGTHEPFEYHGDLKPENIMITPSGVVLIDPGYFGLLDIAKNGTKQQLASCAVTTPIYYPFLEPDDLMALGLIMWEIACREHPLSRRAYSGDFDRKKIGKDLWDLVKAQEAEGKYFLSAILGAHSPSASRPGMPLEVEELLLRSLRLTVQGDGKLNLCDGFQSFAEFADKIANLLARNKIRYL